MPIDVETEITIARPRAEVAAYASEPENATTWYANIESAEWQNQKPLAVGSRFAFVASFLGRRLSDVYEVKEYVEGDRLVMATDGGPLAMETTYTCADAGEGATRMTLRTTASHRASRVSSLRSWPARCDAPVARTWRGSRTSWSAAASDRLCGSGRASDAAPFIASSLCPRAVRSSAAHAHAPPGAVLRWHGA